MIYGCRYYMSSGRAAYKKQPCVHLQWLMTPHGYKYFLGYQWTYGDVPSLFTTVNKFTDPLSFVARVRWLYSFCAPYLI